MPKQTLVIACDGPARAGKTTLAKNFEEKLGIPCLGTGKIYRSLAVLTMREHNVTTLAGVPESKIKDTIFSINLSKLKVTFEGEVLYCGEPFDDLNTPDIANSARIVSHIKEIRAKIVEPLVINIVSMSDYPLVLSEGRDEGRLWRDANMLGLALFLSVDLLVAAMREREIRKAMQYNVPPLRELMNTLMKYDLDNASRSFQPTYIDDDPVIFRGKVTAEVKRTIREKGQIVVPTSSIDADSVFQRVLKLVKTAKLLESKRRYQTSLL